MGQKPCFTRQKQRIWQNEDDEHESNGAEANTDKDEEEDDDRGDVGGDDNGHGAVIRC